MSYNHLKKLIFIILGFYFIAGISTKLLPFDKQKDVIPFFSWFLFTEVPSHSFSYSVRIHEYGGQLFQPPIFFQDAKVIKERASGKARQLIQRMGMSIVADDQEETKRLKELFENAYLPKSARYELGILRFNPLERWQNQQSLSFKSIKEFIKVN